MEKSIRLGSILDSFYVLAGVLFLLVLALTAPVLIIEKFELRSSSALVLRFCVGTAGVVAVIYVLKKMEIAFSIVLGRQLTVNGIFGKATYEWSKIPGARLTTVTRNTFKRYYDRITIDLPNGKTVTSSLKPRQKTEVVMWFNDQGLSAKLY